MCMICAAVPATAAAGAALNAKERSKPNPRPIAKLTAGAIVLLLVASVLYHTQTQ
jgi:hypothetical protein